MTATLHYSLGAGLSHETGNRHITTGDEGWHRALPNSSAHSFKVRGGKAADLFAVDGEPRLSDRRSVPRRSAKLPWSQDGQSSGDMNRSWLHVNCGLPFSSVSSLCTYLVPWTGLAGASSDYVKGWNMLCSVGFVKVLTRPHRRDRQRTRGSR